MLTGRTFFLNFIRWTLSFNLIFFATAKSESSTSPHQSPNTKATMQQIGSLLATIYPYSLDSQALYDQKNTHVIASSLENLKNLTQGLKEHLAHDDDFSFIADSLAKDVSQAATWYKRGNPMEAGFVISYLVENCFACHTKLPASHTPSLPPIKISDEIFAKFSLENKAKFYVATRQFDQAVKTYEQLLNQTNAQTLENFSRGYFIDYFKLNLNVLQDPDHLIKFIEKLLAKKDHSYFLQETLKQWSSDLEDIKINKILSSPSVAAAQNQIRLAKAVTKYGTDQTGIIRLITSSSILHQLLRNPKRGDASKAEILYLLGYVENLLYHSFWLTEARYFLEAAIRKLPHSPLAARAYQLLEEQTILGYSGSSGTHIPEDMQVWLDQLKKLAIADKKTLKN